jgi:hypothetical protein
MTNREKLLKTNEYDALLKMQENLNAANVRGDTPCIMDVLGVADSYERHLRQDNCEECIQKWLNEEES